MPEVAPPTHRLTLLSRRVDLPAASFYRHWSGPHADIILRMPGLSAYVQNHVQECEMGGGWSLPVDGIVETWFQSAHASDTRRAAPELFDELLADELDFLSGLTGFVVEHVRFQHPGPWKVWAFGDLSRRGSGAALASGDALGRRARTAVGEPVMTRPGLGVFVPQWPGVRVMDCRNEAEARRAYRALRGATRGPDAGSALALTRSVVKRAS